MFKNIINVPVISDTVTTNETASGYVGQQSLSNEGIAIIIGCCLFSFFLGIVIEKLIRFFKDCKKINNAYKENKEYKDKIKLNQVNGEE